MRSISKTNERTDRPFAFLANALSPPQRRQVFQKGLRLRPSQPLVPQGPMVRLPTLPPPAPQRLRPGPAPPRHNGFCYNYQVSFFYTPNCTFAKPQHLGISLFLRIFVLVSLPVFFQSDRIGTFNSSSELFLFFKFFYPAVNLIPPLPHGLEEPCAHQRRPLLRQGGLSIPPPAAGQSGDNTAGPPKLSATFFADFFDCKTAFDAHFRCVLFTSLLTIPFIFVSDPSALSEIKKKLTMFTFHFSRVQWFIMSW